MRCGNSSRPTASPENPVTTVHSTTPVLSPRTGVVLSCAKEMPVPAATAPLPTLDLNYFPQQMRVRKLLMGPLGDWHSGVNRVLFGGQAGGGKSGFLVRLAAELALEFSGSRTLLLRVTEDSAVETFVPRMEQFLPAAIAQFQKGEKRWEFPERHDGRPRSVVRLGYAAKWSDMSQYQSEDFDFILPDEAALLDPDLLDFLVETRLRSAYGHPTKVVMGSNPGGPMHERLFTEYIDDKEPYEIYEERRTSYRHGKEYVDIIRRAFVPADVTHNLALDSMDPGYVVRLDNIRDPVLRARLAGGDWTINSGSAFGNFQRKSHIIQPIPLDPMWVRFGGIDVGFKDPSVALWLCQNPETGRLYAYRELAGTEWDAETLKREIAVNNGTDRVSLWYIDSSSRNRTQTSTKTVYDALSESPNALRLERAQKARSSGWSLLRGLFEPLADGLPALQVFDNCKSTIRAIQKAQYEDGTDDIRPFELDHWLDALRYPISSRAYRSPKTQVQVAQASREQVVRQQAAESWRWNQYRTVR